MVEDEPSKGAQDYRRWRAAGVCFPITAVNSSTLLLYLLYCFRVLYLNASKLSEQEVAELFIGTPFRKIASCLEWGEDGTFSVPVLFLLGCLSLRWSCFLRGRHQLC